MPSRDDFQFVLLPWEHRGAHFDPRPDAVVELVWEGTPRQFLLKAKSNVLFFREACRSNDFLCALEISLFAHPLAEQELRDWMQDNSAFVITFWQEEINANRYARCIDGEHPHLEGTFLMFFKQDGQGWVREPWDEVGLAFAWEPDMLWPIPFFEWIPESFPEGFKVFSDAQLRRQLDEREMPREIVAGHPLEWICGSFEELEQITRWMAFTEPIQWPDVTQRTFVFSCENDEGRAELQTIVEDGVWKEPSARLKFLTDLALDFNTPTGIQWQFCDGSSGDPPIRGSWAPEGPEICFSIGPPSQHEMLEARLQLRDWLDGKIPESSVESWL